MVKTIDNAAGKATMEMKWTTTALYKGQVEYGTATTYGSTSQLESDFVKTHVVPLPDLTLSTSYHYRIILKTQDNKEWTSNDYSGKTPSPEQSSSSE